MKSLRTAIYARISSDDGSALGVARQIKDCEALAATKGWRVVDSFVDNDVSASSGKRRPEYERLMAEIRAHHLDALVVWDIDRLTRTPRELEDFIDLTKACGVDLASVGGEMDLATEQGRMMARMKGTVARYEVEQASRRLKSKFLERAQAGKPHGKVAFGYRRESVYDEHGNQIGTREVLEDEQAAAIREAARRLLNRETVRSIVADLNSRSVRTPRGNQWDGTMLRQVLLRQRNAGRRVHQGQVIGKGDWPAILDDDTFDRLTALLTDPSRRTARGNKVRHLLSGIALCGRPNCSGRMKVTGERTRGNKTAPAAYHCGTCHRVRRKESSVDEVVEGVMIARLSMPDGPSLLGGNPAALKESSDTADALEARLNIAADAYADGTMTAEQLRRITAKLRPKIEQARAVARASAPVPELAPLARGNVAEAWKSAGIEVKRAVIDMLMNVTIMPTGSGGRFDPASVSIEWKGQQ